MPVPSFFTSVILLPSFLFYQWGKRGTKKLINLFEVPQEISDAGVQTHAWFHVRDSALNCFLTIICLIINYWLFSGLIRSEVVLFFWRRKTSWSRHTGWFEEEIEMLIPWHWTLNLFILKSSTCVLFEMKCIKEGYLLRRELIPLFPQKRVCCLLRRGLTSDRLRLLLL